MVRTCHHPCFAHIIIHNMAILNGPCLLNTFQNSLFNWLTTSQISTPNTLMVHWLKCFCAFCWAHLDKVMVMVMMGIRGHNGHKVPLKWGSSKEMFLENCPSHHNFTHFWIYIQILGGYALDLLYPSKIWEIIYIIFLIFPSFLGPIC